MFKHWWLQTSFMVILLYLRSYAMYLPTVGLTSFTMSSPLVSVVGVYMHGFCVCNVYFECVTDYVSHTVIIAQLALEIKFMLVVD